MALILPFKLHFCQLQIIHDKHRHSWLMNWKCGTFGNELDRQWGSSKGPSPHVTGSQPELSHCSRRENDRNSSLKRRIRENEALCASLSPAQRPLQGMLYFKVPSTGGRGICWMPTKLPVFMRNILTLFTQCLNFKSSWDQVQNQSWFDLSFVSLKLFSTDAIDQGIDIYILKTNQKRYHSGAICENMAISPPGSLQPFFCLLLLLQ